METKNVPNTITVGQETNDNHQDDGNRIVKDSQTLSATDIGKDILEQADCILNTSNEANIQRKQQQQTYEIVDENESRDNSNGSQNITDTTSTSNDNDNATDDAGDPIPSGTGIVNRECSASDLVGWSDVLQKWHLNLSQRPKELSKLVRQGVPEPLRGEVWQLLCEAQEAHLMEQYPVLLSKTASAEQIILRDVHRTYPAHEDFRTTNPKSLLDPLFKVCKAYAVLDEEVGYCQGLSFLVAALLLHMPEEQAFCVFVRIMQNYGLRDMFRSNFEELYLKFYQLDHLLQDQLPDLHSHFAKHGIEPFMYASQWFLTVFTAKFPLNAVFFIMDVFLLDGMNTIFQVSIALLALSKSDLLKLDFEGVLKYFRVQMPKRYRDQENVEELMTVLSNVSLKKLKSHAKSYELQKQKEKVNENSVTRLQRENHKLAENNLRLEQENDDLARELVSSKIQLRAQMDKLEDKNDTLNQALIKSRNDCNIYLSNLSDIEDEKARLEVEVKQLKELCRRELRSNEREMTRDKQIIQDYKKISSQLSSRIELQFESIVKFVAAMRHLVAEHNCDKELTSLYEKETESFLLKLRLQLDNEKQETSDSEKKESIDKTSNLNLQQQSPTASSSSDLSSPANSTSKNRIGAYQYTLDEFTSMSSEAKVSQLSRHVDELEVELARTKLALVEAECRCQQLTHDLNASAIKKTVNSTPKGKLDSVKAAATKGMMYMVTGDVQYR